MRLFIFILIFFTSCSSLDKANRQMLKETNKAINDKRRQQRENKEEIAEGQLVFGLKIQNKVTYNFVAYNNNVFTYNIGNRSQKFILYAGTFKKSSDTLYLEFFKGIKPEGVSGIVYIDRAKQQLVIVGDTLGNRRLAIHPKRPFDKDSRVISDNTN